MKKRVLLAWRVMLVALMGCFVWPRVVEAGVGELSGYVHLAASSTEGGGLLQRLLFAVLIALVVLVVLRYSKGGRK